MKKFMAKIMAFVLMFACAFPVGTMMSAPIEASAATVALAATKKTVVAGNTYTVTLNNKTDVSKVAWKSSNTKVATVNGKGLVTAVAAGTAKITCTATLKSGGTKALTCTITVKNRIKATSVSLNSVHKDINAQMMSVGDTYDFNTKLTPSNSTDATYYTIADTDIATVNTAGIVTAKKAGITVLEARIGLNKTDANRAANTVVARTYIYIQPKAVVTPTPTPTPTPAVEPKALSVNMVSSKEISIKFNTTIQKSSVIDNNGNLVEGAITITPGKNATQVGTLTAALTSDKMAVNLTTTDEFLGDYVITVFNKILSEDNQIISARTFQSNFKDTVGPSYVGSTVDESGYICNINFNEAIDISGLSILSVNGTSDTTIKSYLTTAGNYTLSADKKSLTVSLAGMGQKAMTVMVLMAGIKDLKGNTSVPFQQSVSVMSDATEKPLANIVEAKRESKTLLTVTFDRPIQYGGNVIVDGVYLNGVVDPLDKKKVNYTITNTAITGSKTITVSGWLNYNVANSANNSRMIAVDFTMDATAPAIISNDLISDTENGSTIQKLVIMYNKKINVGNGSGLITATVNSANGNIYQKQINYTASADNKSLTLNFNNQTLEAGNYTFTVPAGIAVDTLGNASKEEVITVAKQVGTSTELPPPAVTGDASRPGKVIVSFANKLDITSAQTCSNYVLNNQFVPISARLTSQSENSAVVELTFKPGDIQTSGQYAIRITGIKGYNNSYGFMSEYNTIISLVENSCPELVSCKLTSNMSAVLTMTKDVTGYGDFQIYTSNGLLNATSCYVSGNSIYVSFPQPVVDTTYLRITTNNFVGTNNNPASFPETIYAVKAY